jgi:hypothetical protein
MKTRLQWLAVGVLATLASALPPPLRGTCVSLANGALVAQRIEALAQATARYVSRRA